MTTLAEDMAAYWIAYDALATQAEKNALELQFLLDHGAHWRREASGIYGYNPNADIELVGGIYPVRAP